ncbi:MAG: aminotransferase class III-fold pyridoxal phosphate-dependent enzyme, partial [Candidatus Xenobia bacterium]
MLVDGFDMVIDLQRSRGARLYCAKHDNWYLDFFSFFVSLPIGMNHPHMVAPDFLGKLALAAVNKPSNSDVYTVEMAEFVETFSRVAIPDYLPHAFFIEGGAAAVENALKTAFDWKVRHNFAKGLKVEKGHQILHFQRAFHGRSGYTLSLTNTDPAKTAYFPKFEWPRVLNPSMRFPLTEENLCLTEEAERESIRQIMQAIKDNPDDIAGMIIEPIQGEGGDHHFRKEFMLKLREICDEHDILLIMDEVQTGVGLTGKMWAHQHFVEPDIISFGKKSQVCGILAGPRVHDVTDNVFAMSSRINS